MRTILLPFYDDVRAQAALGVACKVAQRWNGHVEGLFVLRPPPVFEGEGIALAGSYMTQFKEEGRRLADAARDRFHTAIAQHGVPLRPLSETGPGPSAGWREAEGLEGPVVGDLGRLFDLLVLGREFGHPWIDWHVVCEAGLFESGRPVLVVPESPPEVLGDTVVVAWNGSTETARTIACAMPWLVEAKSVTVLTVEGAMVPGPTGEELARHLVRNGVPATARALSQPGKAPAETLLEEVSALGADLIVKGAYTHSRLRQLVFGGVTRHLLNTATVPVLFAH